jgi:hypothetical protein
VTGEEDEDTGSVGSSTEESTEEATEGEGFAPLAVSAPLEAGTYRIYAAVSYSRVLDISGGSRSSGANVQIYQTNNTKAQYFDLSYDSEGYYTIRNINSGLVLDVQWGQDKSGVNVQQYAPNGTLAQKWVLTQTGSTYTISSALPKGLVLDVQGARNANGANVQIYTPNNTLAQRFYILPIDKPVSTTPDIAFGNYRIATTLAGTPVIDISGGSKASGVQLQIYPANNTISQVFQIAKGADGYYTIKPLVSGHAFDVAGASAAATTAVQQYTNNNTAAQRWSIKDNGDGTYTFISKQNGLALDVAGGKAAATTKLHLYFPNATAAQKFTLTPATTSALYTGFGSLTPATATAKRVDIASGSKSEAANVQAYASNSTLAQKFEIIRVSGSTYAFRSLVSGLYLTANITDLDVEQHPSQGTEPDPNQQWTAAWIFGGIQYTSVADPTLAMALVGSDIKLVTATGAATEAFTVSGARLIEPGYYIVKTPAGLALDVQNGSTADGANVQLYTANNTDAQKWALAQNSDGSYTLSAARARKALDIKSASTADGANVQIYTANATAAQKWTPVPTGDGYFYLKSALGTYLAASGGGVASGANVYSYSSTTPDLNLALKLSFTATTYSSLAGTLSDLNAASGARAVTGFGGYTPSAARLGDIQNAVNQIRNSGYDVGFILIDINSGRGISYNPDGSFFSASTIKGPYVASVVANNPGSLNSYYDSMYDTIKFSSNLDYSNLRSRFGVGPMAQWCSEAGVSTAIASQQWPNYSSRELAKLWARNYEYFFGNYTDSARLRDLYTGVNHSSLGQLRPWYAVYSKAGWQTKVGWNATNDAGIVIAGDRPYIVVMLTNAPNRQDWVDNLLWTLEGAHKEM